MASILILILMGATQAQATGFSALVSPPRFEVSIHPGEVFRDVIAITNTDSKPLKLSVKTADWILDASGAPIFSEALAEGSCRPWSALESREIIVGPRATFRFRFEIKPPATSKDQECRFALLFENSDDSIDTAGPLPPVSGRIGVIVYAAIGNVEPHLILKKTRVGLHDGKPLPEMIIENTGLAHGRLEGFVNATDNQGEKTVLFPSNLPILAGETRTITLNPEEIPGKEHQTLAFPLTVKGRLEWGRSSLTLDALFTQ